MSKIQFDELAQVAATGDLAKALLETTKRIIRNEEEIVILRRLASSIYSHLDDIDEADVRDSEFRMGEVLDKYEEFLMDNNRPQIGLIHPGNCFFHGTWDTDVEPHCPGCKAERAAALSDQEEPVPETPPEMKFFANGKRITPKEAQKYINSEYREGDPPDLTKVGRCYSRVAGWILSWMPVTGQEADFPVEPQSEEEG